MSARASPANGPLLNSNWIRLCRIVEGSGLGGLDIEYLPFRLKDAPPYRALSYTWGPAEGVPEDNDTTTTFDVLSGTHLDRGIPKNVLRAMLQLQQWGTEEWYWIDRICIDQNHYRERGEQVGIMDQIFQRAERVDIWLGSSNKDTPKLIEIIEDLSGRANDTRSVRKGNSTGTSPRYNRREHILPDEDWRILTDFLSRRWFHRLWTMQEFALAKEVRMLCGNHTIDHDQLKDAAEFLYYRYLPLELSYGKIDIAGAAILQQNLMRDSVRNIRGFSDFFPQYSTERHDVSQHLEYETVLAWAYWRSASTLATDTRDYVYGIIGIANSLMESALRHRPWPSLTHSSYVPIEADYSLTAPEVYRKFITTLMKGSMGIRAISLIQPSPEWEFQSRQRNITFDLPSWIPNLADRDRFALSNHGGLTPFTQRSQPLSVFGQRTPKLSQDFRINGDDLHVWGRRIGTIHESSRPFPYSSDYKYCAEFGLNLNRVLDDLSQESCNATRSLAEALIRTMSLDRHLATNAPSSPFSPDPLTPLHIDEFLVRAAALVILSGVWNNEPVDSLLAEDYTVEQLYRIVGNASFLQHHVMSWRSPKTFVEWHAFDAAARDVFIPLSEVCTLLAKSFYQAHGQRVFTLDVDASFDRSEGCRLLGMGSDMIEKGDEVWAVQGSEWPFVFRRKYHDEENLEPVMENASMAEGTEKVEVYRLVGETYVDGVMEGELLEHKDDLELSEITLR